MEAWSVGLAVLDRWGWGCACESGAGAKGGWSDWAVEGCVKMGVCQGVAVPVSAGGAGVQAAESDGREGWVGGGAALAEVGAEGGTDGVMAAWGGRTEASTAMSRLLKGGGHGHGCAVLRKGAQECDTHVEWCGARWSMAVWGDQRGAMRLGTGQARSPAAAEQQEAQRTGRVWMLPGQAQQLRVQRTAAAPAAGAHCGCGPHLGFHSLAPHPVPP
eukprot:919118-Pelagomonas_calceolata.AAC.13